MFNIDTVTLFAFFGTFQGLIFAAIFWYRNKTISNKIFAFLLLATSIRIAKNIFVHLRDLNPEMFSNYELWRIMVYTGLSHQLAIGPLFLFYFHSKLDSKFRWHNSLFWHFLPYTAFIVTGLFVKWEFWKNGGLWTCYVSIFIYYLLAFRGYIKHQHLIDSGTKSWLKGLLLITGILMVAYSPMLFRYIGYAGGGLLYTLAILSTGYIMLTSKGKFSFFRTKYETSSLNQGQASEIRIKLEQVMKDERPYLNPEMTLQKLAESLEIQPHHLSRVINQELKISFADYINTFRLEEATARLKDNKYDHLKISALAYECGFNSVPTFNTLFKKVHKSTPSDYRKKFKSSQS